MIADKDQLWKEAIREGGDSGGKRLEKEAIREAGNSGGNLGRRRFGRQFGREAIRKAIPEGRNSEGNSGGTQFGRQFGKEGIRESIREGGCFAFACFALLPCFDLLPCFACAALLWVCRVLHGFLHCLHGGHDSQMRANTLKTARRSDFFWQ